MAIMEDVDSQCIVAYSTIMFLSGGDMIRLRNDTGEPPYHA